MSMKVSRLLRVGCRIVVSFPARRDNCATATRNPSARQNRRHENRAASPSVPSEKFYPAENFIHPTGTEDFGKGFACLRPFTNADLRPGTYAKWVPGDPRQSSAARSPVTGRSRRRGIRACRRGRTSQSTDPSRGQTFLLRRKAIPSSPPPNSNREEGSGTGLARSKVTLTRSL